MFIDKQLDVHTNKINDNGILWFCGIGTNLRGYDFMSFTGAMQCSKSFREIHINQTVKHNNNGFEYCSISGNACQLALKNEFG